MQDLWINFSFQKKMNFSKYKLSTTLDFINGHSDMFYYTLVILLEALFKS